MNSPPLLTLAELERLQRQTLLRRHAPRRAVASPWSGAARSIFRGRGMELDDLRAYQAGDDVRHMDWRATARSGRPMTKVFREERQRLLYLLIDRGPAMHFGTRVETKAATAARVAAILAFSALAQQEQVAGLVLDGRRERAYAAVRRLDGVLPMLRAACAAPGADPRDAADWPAVWDDLRRNVSRGTTVCVISDLLGVNEEQRAQLWRLAALCEVIFFQIIDPAEEHLPDAGRLRLTAGDGRIHLIDTGDKTLRERYAAAMAERAIALRRLCDNTGIRLQPVYTHRDAFSQMREAL